MVFADQRDAYLTALEAADAGHPEAFVRFCAERVIDTVQLLKTDLRASARPGLADRVARVQGVLAERTEPLPGEMDELALRLLEEFGAAAQTAAQQFSSLDWLRFTAEIDWSGTKDAVPGYRVVGSSFDVRGMNVQVRLVHGDEAHRRLSIQCATEAGRPDVIVVVEDDGQVILDAFLWDLTPTLSSAVKYRVTAAAEALLADLVAQVTPPAPLS